MTDVLVVAVICGLFVLCVLYVGFCDRIIGASDAPSSETASQPSDVFAAGSR